MIRAALQGKTPIQNFFTNKTVFITGATGFVGTLLVEKILRACPDVGKILILVRNSRTRTAEDRIQQYFDNPVFATIKKSGLNYKDKVKGIVGDITQDNLGLKPQDLDEIKRNANVIIHSAASVKFREPLKDAIAVNLKAVKEAVAIAKETEHLQSMVHISTTYVHSPLNYTEEKILPHPMSPDTLLQLGELLDKKTLDRISTGIIDSWPNTYTYTKNAAENYIEEHRGDLPIAIFRPGAVINAFFEPTAGWVQQFVAATGIVLSFSTGVTRVVLGNGRKSANVTPVDFIVNGVMATAWDTAANHSKELKIYNFSTEGNRITWKDYFTYSMATLKETPHDSTYFYPWFILVSNPIIYKILTVLLHQIPAAVYDLILRLKGEQAKMLKLTMKRDDQLEVLFYFLLKEWSYENKNITHLWRKLTADDQRLFNFDITSVNWRNVLQPTLAGIKEYLFKEDMTAESLSKAKEKLRRTYLLNISSVFGTLAIIGFIGKAF